MAEETPDKTQKHLHLLVEDNDTSPFFQVSTYLASDGGTPNAGPTKISIVGRKWHILG